MGEGLKKIVGQFDNDNARGTQEFERSADESIRRESDRIDALEAKLEALQKKVDSFHP